MTSTAPIDAGAVSRSLAPFAEARTLPADAYTSPEILVWEREHLFDGSWVCVGRASELPRPGDQRAVRLGGGGVLLVRDDGGSLRGFSNTCRHRGHELLPCGGPVANGPVVMCPYHSWTYRLDGSFQAAPSYRDRPGFEADDPDHGLHELRVGEWAGWVFVNASGGAPDLAEHIGNLEQALAPYEPERLSAAASHDYTVRANWKLLVENFHECYHCADIHPELCRVSPPESGRQFHPSGLVVGGSLDLVDGAETMSLTGESGGSTFRALDGTRRREVHYFGVFPNLLISAHPDYVMTHRLEPLAHDETLVECRWLFAPESLEREGFDAAYAAEFWDLTNTQDWAACESVQRGAAGQGYRQAPLSDMEGGVYQFIGLVARGYLEGRAVGPVPDLPAVALGSA